MRNFTESDLRAVDDALPTVPWTMNFLREQGYDLIQSLRRATIAICY